jgi:Tfp pilus assembly PilM family ATPase
MGLLKQKARSVVGLDIEPGFMAAAEFSNGGRPALQRAATAALAPGLFHEGEVTNVDGLAEQLRTFFRDNGLPKVVRLGVASQKIVVRVIELPDIEGKEELDAAVRFQAQEELPMPLEQAVLDHRVLERFHDGESPRMRVLMVAARRDTIDHLLTAARKAGLDPQTIDLSAFAIVRALYVPPPQVAPTSGDNGERSDNGVSPQVDADSGRPEQAVVDVSQDVPAIAPVEPLPADEQPAPVEPSIADEQPAPAEPLPAQPPADLRDAPVADDAPAPDPPDFAAGPPAVEQTPPPPTFAVPQEAAIEPPAAPPVQPPVVPLTSMDRSIGDQPGDAQQSAIPVELDPSAQNVVLYCHVGGLTNLAVASGTSCVFNRVLQNGIESMAATLAERKALTLEHARQWINHVALEKTIENIEGEREIVAEARDVLARGVSKIADEIRLSVEYYQGSVPNAGSIERIVLAGQAIALPGFPAALEREVGLTVEPRSLGALEIKPGALDNVDGAQLTVAAGLALDEVRA